MGNWSLTSSYLKCVCGSFTTACVGDTDCRLLARSKSSQEIEELCNWKRETVRISTCWTSNWSHQIHNDGEIYSATAAPCDWYGSSVVYYKLCPFCILFAVAFSSLFPSNLHMHDCVYCMMDFTVHSLNGYWLSQFVFSSQWIYFYIIFAVAFSAPYSSLSLHTVAVQSSSIINTNNFQSDCLVLNSMVTALVDSCTVNALHLTLVDVCVHFWAYQLYAVIKRTISQGQSTVLCTWGKYILGELNPLTSYSCNAMAAV